MKNTDRNGRRPEHRSLAAEITRQSAPLSERVKYTLEALRNNAQLLGTTSVVAIAAVTAATCLSLRAVTEIKGRADSPDSMAVLVPLALAILALLGAQVLWSIRTGTDLQKRAQINEERAKRLEEQMSIVSDSIKAVQFEQSQIKSTVDTLKDEAMFAQKFEPVVDNRELWTGFVQDFLTDAPKFDKEMSLRENADGSYTAIARAERIGHYVLERLSRSSALKSWTVTFYLQGDGSGPFERLSWEPALRFVAMIETVRQIARKRRVAIDLGKLRIVLCNGSKPDVATFLPFRARPDGLFERILIEYARPLDPNRAHQVPDRATIVRCPQEIIEREGEIKERIARGRVVSFEEIADLLKPGLRDIFIVDAENLPGFAFDGHLSLGEPWRIIVADKSDQAAKPAARSGAKVVRKKDMR
jgi:hypothetical protein